MTAKAIPWANIIAIIQAIISAFGGGICPAPANKAQLQAIRLKRARLAAAGRQQGLSFADAFAAADAALLTLEESPEPEVDAFLADCAS